MTDFRDTEPRNSRAPLDEYAVAGVPVSYRGVLSSRLIAYLIDIVAIFFFSAILFVAFGILGLLTFGLGWALMPLIGLSGILYSAITVGGSRHSTIGMRVMGLVVVTGSGRRPDILSAAIHALLFYVAAGTFLLLVFDILIGFARRDRRLGHDIVVDFAVVNA